MADLIGMGWGIPDSVRDVVEFHWFHVPTGGALLLCCVSREPAWYLGHFHQGRMRRCPGTGCELCARQIGRQVRFIVSCVELTTRRVGVLELGVGPAKLLEQWAASNGGLRGVSFELTRASKAKHSRLELTPVREHPGAWVDEVQAVNLGEVMQKTWNRQTG